MEKEINEIDIILKEIGEMKEKVPFSNSDFQIQKFVIDGVTAERCYRSSLLQLNQKIIALQESKFRRERYLVDIEEAKDKLKKDNIDKYEKRRLEILIDEKVFYYSNEEKLINDCIRECKLYYTILKKLPDINREKFENSEQSYWIQRLQRDAINDIKIKGIIEKATLESLNKLGIDLKKENNQIVFFVMDNVKEMQLL